MNEIIPNDLFVYSKDMNEAPEITDLSRRVQ